MIDREAREVFGFHPSFKKVTPLVVSRTHEVHTADACRVQMGKLRVVRGRGFEPLRSFEH
jgi:hypothetical protein